MMAGDHTPDFMWLPGLVGVLALGGMTWAIARGRRFRTETIVLVGSGAIASLLTTLLREYHRYPFGRNQSLRIIRVPTLEEARTKVLAGPCDLLVLAGVETPSVPIVDVRSRRVPIVSGRNLIENALGWLPLEVAADDPLLASLQRVALPGSPYRIAKRIIDVIVATFGGIALVPIGLLVAIVVLLDTPGPILTAERRVGLHGRPFRLYFFCTNKASEASRGVASARAGTRIGRMLRRTHLDALPVLWSIIRGDLSLVGPLPARVAEADTLARELPLYPHRHGIRPGLLSWPSPHQRRDNSLRDARRSLEYDLYYVKHVSFRLDVRVIRNLIRVPSDRMFARPRIQRKRRSAVVCGVIPPARVVPSARKGSVQ